MSDAVELKPVAAPLVDQDGWRSFAHHLPLFGVLVLPFSARLGGWICESGRLWRGNIPKGIILDCRLIPIFLGI
jgi:hypothetical protein